MNMWVSNRGCFENTATSSVVMLKFALGTVRMWRCYVVGLPTEKLSWHQVTGKLLLEYESTSAFRELTTCKEWICRSRSVACCAGTTNTIFGWFAWHCRVLSQKNTELIRQWMMRGTGTWNVWMISLFPNRLFMPVQNLWFRTEKWGIYFSLLIRHENWVWKYNGNNKLIKV